eukprot:4425178-Pleurochrysis_carterae.AAC.2
MAVKLIPSSTTTTISLRPRRGKQKQSLKTKRLKHHRSPSGLPVLYFHCVVDQQTTFYNTHVLTQEGVAQNSDTKHFKFNLRLRLRKG